MSAPLNEHQKREQDLRLYGPEEAITRATERQREDIERQLAQRNLGITQNTPGLGSNGEGRQERDGYKPEASIPVSANGLDVCREGRSIAVPAFENSSRGGYVAPQGVNPGLLPVRELSPKTGYEPAVDNRQVPSPTDLSHAGLPSQGGSRDKQGMAASPAQGTAPKSGSGKCVDPHNSQSSGDSRKDGNPRGISLPAQSLNESKQPGVSGCKDLESYL